MGERTGKEKAGRGGREKRKRLKKVAHMKIREEG
jgi:hypothetical protein